MKRRALPLLVFAAALVWCWPRLMPLTDSAFNVPPPVKSATASAINADLHAELLPRAAASAHAVTLVQLGDGKFSSQSPGRPKIDLAPSGGGSGQRPEPGVQIMAAWFAGSHEGAPDVAIYNSTYDQGIWSTPQRIADRQLVEHDTQRLIRKLGNPLLWRDARNVLHLWFVSVSYGGWAGSAINHMQSNDDGQHWSTATRIVSSPFWNLSTLVRNPPLALADGGIALPAYHEFLTKRPEWLRFDSRLMLIDKARFPDSARTLQPAATALDEYRALALMRDAGSAHRIYAARSQDAGTHWESAEVTAIDNPNAAIALIRLADGSLLLACNPLESNRNRLALLRSHDEGRHWSAPFVIEQGTPDEEFSYPALLQDSVGIVHLAYTWKRQAIKHVALPPAQIEVMQ